MAQATNTSLGEIRLAGDLSGSNNALAPELSSTGVTPGGYTNPTITVDAKGRITAAASGSIDDLNVPNATFVDKGIVQIGTGLDIEDGILSLDAPNATTISLGVVQIGLGLDVEDGIVSSLTPDASSSVKGVCQIGDGIAVSNGIISANLPFATNSTKGICQAGTGVNVTAGVISIPDATNSTKGIIVPGIGLNTTAGQLDAIVATSSNKGICQIGFGLSISNGILSLATVPDATTSIKGVVTVGTNIVVSSGVISVPNGSDSVKGILQVGDGLVSTAGVISLDAPDATNSTKGICEIGSGLNVSAGVVSVPDATTSIKGAVSIGAGLNVSAGVVSSVLADGNTTFGIVKSNNTSNITISSGLIDIGSNVAKKDVANTYTKAQAVAISTITYAAAITPDFSQSNVFYLNPTGNFILNAPTNMVNGGMYHIIVTQDATGGRLISWDSVYKFKGLTPSLTTIPNYTDIISVIVVDSSNILTEVQKGYA